MYIFFFLDPFDNTLEAVFMSCLLFQAAKRDFKVLVLKVVFKI